MSETSNSGSVSTKQERIATLARQNPQMSFTSLAHHMDEAWLEEAYRRTRKSGAAGVDECTAEQYAVNLKENLRNLHERLKAKRYTAPPVRRSYIPKPCGKEKRAIGVPTFEDKVVQRAVTMLLTPIYEQDFLGCSYGFRLDRSAHQALESLRSCIMEYRGGWILEADIRKCFDMLSHSHIQEILRKRVSDGVVRQLIGKWLNAGVMESGVMSYSDQGTPQGGVISPLICNLYLHEVLDKWFEHEIKHRLKGKARLFRWVDDFVIVFEQEGDALRVMAVLAKRFERFGLQIHPQKSRIVPFKRPRFSESIKDARKRGRCGTFNFLGFTHCWYMSNRGNWIVRQRTARDRLSRSIQGIAQWCKKWRHMPIKEQQKILTSKLRGHYNYFGVTGNTDQLKRFCYSVRLLWKKWLSRRSNRANLNWDKFNRLLVYYPLPAPRIVHVHRH